MRRLSEKYSPYLEMLNNGEPWEEVRKKADYAGLTGRERDGLRSAGQRRGLVPCGSVSHHMTSKKIAEMRKLRNGNWTLREIATFFNCSKDTVRKYCGEVSR